MRPNEDGVYRWRYSLNLYRNAVLLRLFYKVFSCVFAVCVLFGLWLNDFKFSLEATKWALVGYAAMIVLVTVSYYFYALIQGGRYTWDFEMDENGVNAVQVANEAKRNKVLGTVVAAMGVASGNLSHATECTANSPRPARSSQTASTTPSTSETECTTTRCSRPTRTSTSC